MAARRRPPRAAGPPAAPADGTAADDRRALQPKQAHIDAYFFKSAGASQPLRPGSMALLSGRLQRARASTAFAQTSNALSVTAASAAAAAPSTPAVVSALMQRPLNVGLRNLGNSCYANSVLQVLRHCPDFTQSIRELIRLHGVAPVSAVPQQGLTLLCALRDLIHDMDSRVEAYRTQVEQMLRGTGDPVPCLQAPSPQLLLQGLRTVGDQFLPGLQQDAQEFMYFLLAHMESLAASLNVSQYQAPSDESFNAAGLFRGQLRHVTRCLECDTASAVEEPFFSISLPVQLASGPLRTLMDALEAFRAAEWLIGSNKYRCERCMTTTEAQRTVLFSSLPRILNLHLKRFSMTGDGMQLSKLCDHIAIPETLAVECQLDGAAAAPELGTYDLVGIICHNGVAMAVGHYIAYVKQPASALEKQLRRYLRDVSTAPPGAVTATDGGSGNGALGLTVLAPPPRESAERCNRRIHEQLCKRPPACNGLRSPGVDEKTQQTPRRQEDAKQCVAAPAASSISPKTETQMVRTMSADDGEELTDWVRIDDADVQRASCAHIRRLLSDGGGSGSMLTVYILLYHRRTSTAVAHEGARNAADAQAITPVATAAETVAAAATVSTPPVVAATAVAGRARAKPRLRSFTRRTKTTTRPKSAGKRRRTRR